MGIVKNPKLYFQNRIDEIYGKNIWTLEEYTRTDKPIVIKHKCGELKRVTRGSSFLRGNAKCKCEKQTRNKPTFSTDKINNQINELSQGRYKLLSEYKGIHSKVLVKNNIDNSTFETTTHILKEQIKRENKKRV